jgi:SecD/SecF fusion protein
MPTNNSGRVSLILVVLFLALWAIFPTGNFKHPNLKPGIDMVGGTSLLYEIKVPPNGAYASDLSEKVMESLKKRVDPQGVKNLVWRPQGPTRLEIQMPLTAQSKQTAGIREAYDKAQQALEATNVRTGEALYAVQELSGEDRRAKITELSHGSKTREEILSSMASTWDQIKAAREQKNAAEQARLEIQYNQLQDRLEETNLNVTDLQGVLDLKPEARAEALEALKKRFADYPARLSAIDNFATEYAAYSQVKGVIDDAAELKRLLQGSGVIEFHILATDLPQDRYQEMVDRLQRRGPRSQAGDDVRWYQVDRADEVAEEVDRAIQAMAATNDPRERNTIIRSVAQGNDRVAEVMQTLAANLNNPSARDALKNQIIEAQTIGHPLVDYAGKKWALAYITPQASLMRREGQPEWHLQSARVVMPQGTREVEFIFDPQGAKLFGDLTSTHINQPLAIVLDEKMISAPNINSAITGGSGVITGGGRGGFSESEAGYLASTLNAGALPAQLTEEPISEQTVGPQLGADNLRAGLYASIIGLLVVGVFTIVYYHISGIVAVVALCMNMLLILGVMAALDATFTLPAIAGIVLTIGMSVDANVLVFERLREELDRGLSLRMALRYAYDRALSAIVDSNAVTAITCVILYYIGTEEIKGFGLTLLIGLVSSLFTALFVTKTIFAVMLNKFDLKHLGSLPQTLPQLNRLLHPKVNWMGKTRYFMAFSAVFLVIGFVAMGMTMKKGELLDIEFSSGTNVQFALKQPTPIAEVRRLISSAPEADLPQPSVVAVGSEELSYSVITPSNDQKAVTGAIIAALGDRLNIQTASKYDMVDQTASEAMDKAIFPIAQDTRTVGGFSPAALRSHVGGAAFVLNNLNPPITSADEIKNRMRQARLQPTVGGSVAANAYRPIDVEIADGGKTAIILTSDPNAPYDASDAIKVEQWQQDLVEPMWKQIREAVNNPPQFQGVTNFNPSVAGEMQMDALMALAMSVIVIMVYIWLRFGNLKYGTATVVAMLHDTLMVIAAIGMSHYIGKTYVGRELLLVEPFRVNLTLVAAVLTVMSYSMVDTIVVFDRIRENRGKFGHLDGSIVNDSINQTLSRTLLTAGTTVMTVFVMYIFGGEGIHGFTFVMLIGILVGTYSSIAIAAPILLIGEGQTQTKTGKPVGQRQLQGA